MLGAHTNPFCAPNPSVAVSKVLPSSSPSWIFCVALWHQNNRVMNLRQALAFTTDVYCPRPLVCVPREQVIEINN